MTDERDRPVSYRDAGVDIEAGERAVEAIKAVTAKTHGPGVLGGIGGFGGLFALKDALNSLEDPVLVSGTDGVGTKLLVACAADKHDTVGQDLVAMCVNDILTLGARPLFFLDYFGTGVLEPAQMAEVVTGIATACEAVGCALLGGETAELPGLYKKGEYDLAGFCVGAVERSAIVDGKRAKAGDAIVGLASSGIHSNGLSLARRVIAERLHLGVHEELVDGKSVSELLLTPTRLYVNAILELLNSGATVRAMAHITGGGIPGNLARPLADGLGARVESARWQEPALFGALRRGGPVDEGEMRKTFNLGVGFAVFVPADEAEATVAALEKSGETAWVIGEVVEGEGVTYVEDAS